MTIRPLNKNVVVERIAAEKSTSSGIILKSSEGPDKAKIIAVGPEATEVKVDEIVLINWNSARKIEGETYTIPVDDIIFVYED